jgi:hypothetical protein
MISGIILVIFTISAGVNKVAWLLILPPPPILISFSVFYIFSTTASYGLWLTPPSGGREDATLYTPGLPLVRTPSVETITITLLHSCPLAAPLVASGNYYKYVERPVALGSHLAGCNAWHCAVWLIWSFWGELFQTCISNEYTRSIPSILGLSNPN